MAHAECLVLSGAERGDTEECLEVIFDIFSYRDSVVSFFFLPQGNFRRGSKRGPNFQQLDPILFQKKKEFWQTLRFFPKRHTHKQAHFSSKHSARKKNLSRA